jgi:hypothetical protein
MFDKLLTRTHTWAEHELDDEMRRQRQTIKEALAALRSLGAIILDDTVENDALRQRLNSCSCLTLILACVIYWQAKEISRVAQSCRPADDKIDLAMLEHVSPIEWDNVILYGQYVLNRDQVR